MVTSAAFRGNAPRPWAGVTTGATSGSAVRRVVRQHLHSDPLAAYACPACKGKLEAAENVLRCAACQVAYPLVDGIPDFLREDREQSLGPVSRGAGKLDRAPLRDAALVRADPEAGRRPGRAELRRGHPADGGLDGRPRGAVARRRLRAGDLGPAAAPRRDGRSTASTSVGRCCGRACAWSQRQAQSTRSTSPTPASRRCRSTTASSTRRTAAARCTASRTRLAHCARSAAR